MHLKHQKILVYQMFVCVLRIYKEGFFFNFKYITVVPEPKHGPY